MTTLYQDIRGALQNRAILTSGLPPANQRQYEGMTFKPTVGVPFVRMTLMPSSERPFSVAGNTVRHEGIFQIDAFTPSGGNPGSSAIEQLADKIRAQFPVGLRLPTAGNQLLIRYAERTAIMAQPDWLQISVSIGYRIYSNPV